MMPYLRERSIGSGLARRQVISERSTKVVEPITRIQVLKMLGAQNSARWKMSKDKSTPNPAPVQQPRPAPATGDYVEKEDKISNVKRESKNVN